MESPGHVRPVGRAAQLYLLLPFLLLLFAFFSCQSNRAKVETRTSVKGILQDAAGRPVADAVVMITGGSHEFNDMASVTNDSGEFFLSNVVVPGRYTLQIESSNGTKNEEVNLKDSTSFRLTF